MSQRTPHDSTIEYGVTFWVARDLYTVQKISAICGLLGLLGGFMMLFAVVSTLRGLLIIGGLLGGVALGRWIARRSIAQRDAAFQERIIAEHRHSMEMLLLLLLVGSLACTGCANSMNGVIKAMGYMPCPGYAVCPEEMSKQKKGAGS